MSATVSPIKDQTIVYGLCTWWDSIDKANSATPVPTCPHCGSPLFEMTEAEWWNGVERHVIEGNPDFRSLIEWMRGRCFKNYALAKAAYAEES